jgi:hypothetical protein
MMFAGVPGLGQTEAMVQAGAPTDPMEDDLKEIAPSAERS